MVGAPQALAPVARLRAHVTTPEGYILEGQWTT